MDCVNQFHHALQAAFGPLDWAPIPDGMIHRFRVPGDKSSPPKGWYWLSESARKGCFGSPKTGGTFTANSVPPVTGFKHG